MTLRSLDSLAHALGAAITLDAALVALNESVADADRDASVAYFRVEPRRGMIDERVRLLGLVMSLAAHQASLAERLIETIRAG